MLKFNLIRDKYLSHQPSRPQIEKWIRNSLQQKYLNTFLSISIVDEHQSQILNNEYRGIDKSTNVISLEYAESRIKFNLLSGELILCDDVIVREANQQNKTIISHYAHMIVHGVLHLQGYDHLDDDEAEIMESIEQKILHKLGFLNPYQEYNENF